MTNSDTLATYLTGELPPHRAETLEHAVLLDDDTFEELLTEETDLLDAYVRAEASREVRAVLRRAVAQNTTMRQRAEFASLLAEVADASTDREEALGVGWRVVGALSMCFALVTGGWVLWGLEVGSSTMPPFVLGSLAWISLCGAVLSTLEWRRTRVRLRTRLEGLEESGRRPAADGSRQMADS